MAFLPISGTFLDGISCDIPSNNWTPDVWEREFARYQANGVDEAYIIRVGWNDSMMYDSKVMKCTLCPEMDMVQLFLDLGAKYNVKIYMGMFDTYRYWRLNDWSNEVAINIDLIHELNERYGNHPAWYGWYMSHEGSMGFHQTQIWKPLCKEIKKFDKTRPIMVSPRYAGSKWSKEIPISPEVHAKHFDYILNDMEGLIDAYAPMDGHVQFNELDRYMAGMYEMTQKYGVQYWSNLETFDRDMPWRFPPIEFAKLKCKLEIAEKYCTKIISFELPHFMSPDSCYPGAGHLYNRYLAYAEKRKAEEK